jgi:MYXO-CTERM domain-containing protein
MKMASRIKLTLALLTMPTLASAAIDIPVANPSFESPVVNPQILPVSLVITGWNTAGPSADVDLGDGNGPRNSGTGIFINPASGPTRFTNATGNQLAYIFSSSGEEIHQTLSSNFSDSLPDGNNIYQLTVMVGNASTPPPPTDQLRLRLFYTAPGADPAVPANRQFIATRDLSNATDTIEGDFLLPFSAFTDPILPGDPAIGRPINVLLTTVGAGGGQFDLEDVSVTAIPEPAGLALAGVGLLAATARRRRSSL